MHSSAGHFWQLQVAAIFAKGTSLRPVLEAVNDMAVGAVDLFLVSPHGYRIGSAATSLWRHEGTKKIGIAIECKSVASVQRIPDRLSEAAVQLRRVGGGVVALDVSALLVEQLADHAPTTNADFDRAAKSVFAGLEQQTLCELRRRGATATKALAGCLLYAEVFNRPSDAMGSEDHVQFCHHRSWSWSLNRGFAPIGICEIGFDGVSLSHFVHSALRSVRTRWGGARRGGGVTCIPAGKSLEILWNDEGDMLVHPCD